MKENPFVTNNKNKIRLSFLISGLALVLMLAFSGTLFLSNKNAQAAVSYWTNSSYRASSYAGGTGTSSNPYKITNGKELALMAYHVNNISGYASKYYSLQNNVSLVAPDKNGNQLVWEPIGTSSIFTGTFWGNGHTISGLYISETTSDYAGLFGQVSGNVESLRVEGTITLKKNIQYVGGIIAKKTRNAVSKLTSNVNILTNSKYVGCVIGYNTSHVEQCISLGSIVGEVIDEQCLGGIAGYSSGSISDCYNKGNISGELHEDTENGIGYNYVGGIVGRISSASIKNCFNLGSIDEGSGIVDFAENCSGIFNCYNKGTIYDGSGIAGYIKNTSSMTLSVKDCYNFGGVYYGKAGLVGIINTTQYFNIRNCYNEGYVVGSGGVVGSIKTSDAFYIQYCYNAGDVQNNFKYETIGGIVGELHRIGNSTIICSVSNCKNTGTIKYGATSCGYAGGIVGDFYGCEVTFLDLLNQGEVKGSSYAGGIFGNFGYSTSYATYSSVISCVNYGKISGTRNVGGIIGLFYPDLSAGVGNLMKCINFGNIYGSMDIGGIVGFFSTKGAGEVTKDSRLGGASISYSINYGSINATSPNYSGCTDAGGIVGWFDSTNLKNGQPRNFIQNCLNVGKVYSNSSSYKEDQYVGSMVGRNVKDAGYMKNIGYYCSDTGIKAFGTKSRKSIDDSNGTAYSRTLSEILTSSFVGDWSTWCEYKAYSNLKNDKLQFVVARLEAAYDKIMSGLVLLKNIDYDGLKLNFDFIDQQTGSSAVWAKDNPLINNGEPYFKDRYW